MAKVLIPTALQQFAGGTDELDVPGATVQEVLDGLGEQYPNLKKQLFNDKGELRHFVNVYKGAEDTRTLQGMDTPVSDADELSIVPSIAGGTAVEGKREEGKGKSEDSLRNLQPSILPNTQRLIPNTRAVISEDRAEDAQLTQ